MKEPEGQGGGELLCSHCIWISSAAPSVQVSLGGQSMIKLTVLTLQRKQRSTSGTECRTEPAPKHSTDGFVWPSTSVAPLRAPARRSHSQFRVRAQKRHDGDSQLPLAIRLLDRAGGKARRNGRCPVCSGVVVQVPVRGAVYDPCASSPVLPSQSPPCGFDQPTLAGDDSASHGANSNKETTACHDKTRTTKQTPPRRVVYACTKELRREINAAETQIN